MRRAGSQSAAWDYLESLSPDVALLQEVVAIPKRLQDTFSATFKLAMGKKGKTQRFGSAVLVKSATIPEMSLPNVAQWSSSYVDHFDGNLIGCGLSGTPDLMILNCYFPAWPIAGPESLFGNLIPHVEEALCEGYSKLYLTDVVWFVLREGAAQLPTSLIVAGDFNRSYTFEAKWNTTGSKQTLDRFKNLGMIEVLSETHSVVVPTFRHARGKIEDQIDHFFVTEDLWRQVSNCQVGDIDKVFGRSLSDHLPIIVDIEFN